MKTLIHLSKLVVLVIALSLTSCSADSIEEGTSPTQAPQNITTTSDEATVDTSLIPEVTDFELEILQLLNEYRVSKGLERLEPLEVILIPAQEHTNYMIAKSDMNHDGFSNRAEYLFKYAKAEYVSENVAVGFTSARSLVDAWIASPTHRKNIEGNVNYFHVYAGQSAEGTWYYTNLFLRK